MAQTIRSQEPWLAQSVHDGIELASYSQGKMAQVLWMAPNKATVLISDMAHKAWARLELNEPTSTDSQKLLANLCVGSLIIVTQFAVRMSTEVSLSESPHFYLLIARFTIPSRNKLSPVGAPLELMSEPSIAALLQARLSRCSVMQPELFAQECAAALQMLEEEDCGAIPPEHQRELEALPGWGPDRPTGEQRALQLHSAAPLPPDRGVQPPHLTQALLLGPAEPAPAPAPSLALAPAEPAWAQAELVGAPSSPESGLDEDAYAALAAPFALGVLILERAPSQDMQLLLSLSPGFARAKPEQEGDDTPERILPTPTPTPEFVLPAFSPSPHSQGQPKRRAPRSNRGRRDEAAGLASLHRRTDTNALPTSAPIAPGVGAANSTLAARRAAAQQAAVERIANGGGLAPEWLLRELCLREGPIVVRGPPVTAAGEVTAPRTQPESDHRLGLGDLLADSRHTPQSQLQPEQQPAQQPEQQPEQPEQPEQQPEQPEQPEQQLALQHSHQQPPPPHREREQEKCAAHTGTDTGIPVLPVVLSAPARHESRPHVPNDQQGRLFPEWLLEHSLHIRMPRFPDA